MSDEQTIIPPARRERRMMIKNLVPSLPERGKIKIGMKGREITSQRGNTFQPPQKLDHFLVTTLERGQDGNFRLDTEFHARAGAAPTAIPIRLLYDDPALNFPTRYAAYVGRALWCSGDGEVAIRMSEQPGQPGQPATQPREVACPCFRQQPGYQGRDKCKMNGSLSVLIEGAGGLGGVWKFRTTGYNSIVGIMSSMAFLRSVSGGVLAGLPLKLTVKPKQAQNPVDGSAVTIYVVGIEFDGDLPQLQNAAHDVALDRARMQVSIANIEEEARRTLMIEGPGNAVLPGDDASDVIDEFYPEQAVAAQAPARSAGTKLEQFEQRHTPHDPETGEVTGDGLSEQEKADIAELTALGDAAASRGVIAFREYWNADDTKLYRKELKGRLKGWEAIATAADKPAPEPEGTIEPQGSPPAHETPDVAATPPFAPEATSLSNLTEEIAIVHGGDGKPVWTAWTHGLLLPRLKRITDLETLTEFWRNNAMHIVDAEAALGETWPREEIRKAWRRVDTEEESLA